MKKIILTLSILLHFCKQSTKNEQMLVIIVLLLNELYIFIDRRINYYLLKGLNVLIVLSINLVGMKMESCN